MQSLIWVEVPCAIRGKTLEELREDFQSHEQQFLRGQSQLRYHPRVPSSGNPRILSSDRVCHDIGILLQACSWIRGLEFGELMWSRCLRVSCRAFRWSAVWISSLLHVRLQSWAHDCMSFTWFCIMNDLSSTCWFCGTCLNLLVDKLWQFELERKWREMHVSS